VFDPARHEPLADIAWSEARARDAIAAVCRDLEAAFDPERLWPLDPVDVEHPSNELLLGAPGTMLAARAMYDRTGEERFAELWRASARTLLERQEPCRQGIAEGAGGPGADGLWTQELYGSRRRFLGAGHGFAGNIRALLGAPEWLDDADAVKARAVATARATAVFDGDTANWPPEPGIELSRVQWCHGAPGFITSLAGDDDLLCAAGKMTWRAGPLASNPGLCHGTGGNGFAF
jgi:lantibiotic modifying enzyme